MRFSATIEQAGKTATGIRVPPEVIASLDAGKRPPVRVTLAAHTYCTTVAPRGDRYLVSLSAENRASAGVAAGDRVDVDIALDTAPRVVEVPDDLAAALEGEPAALTFFEGLSYSQQRWVVLGIEEAKKAETRQRRVTKAVERLRSGRGQR